MQRAISETDRRRKIQTEYNKKNGIIPKSIVKDIRDIIEIGKMLGKNEQYFLQSFVDSGRLIGNGVSGFSPSEPSLLMNFFSPTWYR